MYCWSPIACSPARTTALSLYAQSNSKRNNLECDNFPSASKEGRIIKNTGFLNFNLKNLNRLPVDV